MKFSPLLICTLSFFWSTAQLSPKTKNVFIVTIDGIRCQEVFNGADPVILNNSHYTADIDLAKLMYLDSGFEKSRKKLLPFFWNVIQNKGRLYGNRLYNNKVNVSNSYKFSYPGYNEIFTGYPDIYVSSNDPKNNLNINVFEYLNSLDEFRDKVVAFTSWDIFPYILNKKRSGLKINSGYDSVEEKGSFDMHVFNKAQENLINQQTSTRQDFLTCIAAMEYLKVNKPRVVFIGLGECDEDAHKGFYDQYLGHLNEADKMIQQLWYFIQTTPEYRNTTTLIITTDHGRGKRSDKWTEHDVLVRGSGDAWLAVMGPDTGPGGEMHLPQQLYQKQVASTIATFLGYNFTANHPVARAIDFKKGN